MNTPVDGRALAFAHSLLISAFLVSGLPMKARATEQDLATGTGAIRADTARFADGMPQRGQPMPFNL